MAQLFANNISTVLSNPALSTDSTIYVLSATGMPSPGAPDWFYLTLATPTTPETAWEIVKVTGVAGTALTVVRGQDGTTAAAWTAATRVELRPVGQSMRDMMGAGLTLALAAPPTIGGTTPAAITGTTVSATGSFAGPGTDLSGTALSLVAGAANTASAVTVTATSANGNFNVALFNNAAGSLQGYTANITYNPSTGVLSLPGIAASGNVSGACGVFNGSGNVTTLRATNALDAYRGIGLASDASFAGIQFQNVGASNTGIWSDGQTIYFGQASMANTPATWGSSFMSLSWAGVLTAVSFAGAGTGLTGTAPNLTAGAVAWTNVTGAPTNLSAFTNGPGYATPAALQSQANTSFTTTGTGSAYVGTPAVALAANASPARFAVTFNAVGSGTPTLAVSGLAALPLVQYNASGTLVPFLPPSAGFESDVVCNGTQWIALDPPPVLATGRLVNIKYIPAGGTYTKSTFNPSFVVVQVQGAGGGGGEVGGGGGGGFAQQIISNANLLASETVTIGAGGAGVTTLVTASTGGTSSFGTHCSATGGAGGTSGSGVGAYPGGLGGNGIGGDFNLPGGSGVTGLVTGNGSAGNIGGGSHFAGGAYASATANTGAGGGAGTSNAGGSGLVIIYEYA